jgi:hypothetical protein
LELPSDTLAALQLLRSEFRCIIATKRRPSPLAAPVSVFEQIAPVPVLLRSQLYALVPQRTQADEELAALQAAHTARLCKLPGGLDEFAVVFTEDLEGYVSTC